MESYMNMSKMSPDSIFERDDKSTYYQHLSTTEADKLGWNEDTFILCKIQFVAQKQTSSGRNCLMDVKKISVPNYFNCFRITPDDQFASNRVVSITLLIRLSERDYMNNDKNKKAFIPGILQQFSGLLGVIHTPFTFPDIDKDGFHLEHGKVHKIMFDVIRKTKVSTPKLPCASGIREKIFDLNDTYLFSQQACLKSVQGLRILKQCSCFIPETLRSGIPNITHPYCYNILNLDIKNYNERMICLNTYKRQSNSQTKDILFNECKPSCVSYSYDIGLSDTK